MQSKTTTQPTVATTQPASANQPQGVYGAYANYAKAQQAKAQAQAQRLANATYTLVKPSNANLKRAATGNNTQAQTNANYASAILLQLYPLTLQSGLTPQAQAQLTQHLLQAIYTLQNAASVPTNKQAVVITYPNP